MENLIYDRTQFDVDLDTLKGSYNFEDLNRVEKWCEYLSEILNQYDYNNIINVKTNWQMVDVMTDENSPVEAQMERIRQNLLILRNAFFVLSQTPNIPANLDYMNFQKANDIEKILYDIDAMIGYIENNFVYCGVAGCGQNRIWQHRFRKPKTWISQPYKLSQYTNTDTLKMIATNNNEEITSKTNELELAKIDKRDDVFASIDAINESTQAIDDLIGVPCHYYVLTNILKPIADETFDVGTKSATHKKYGSNSLMISGVAGDNEEYALSSTQYPLHPTHIYFACVEVYSETGQGTIDMFFPSGSPSFFGGKKVYANQWTKWYNRTDRATFSQSNYSYRLDFNNGGVVDNAWFDGAMIVDLTEAFGSGNEPSLDWCLQNISYFTGTKAIKVEKED